MKKLIIIIVLLIFMSSCGKNPVDPVTLIYKIEGTKIEVRGRELFVNDKKFIIKGVGYQPTPIGYNCGAYDIFNDSNIYTRDISLLREMGCNTIRTWAKVTSRAFLDYCFNDGNSPIYVIMGFYYEPNEVISNDTTRANTIKEFKNYVAAYKDHPAVLLWAIGNDDNNVVPNNDSDRKKLYEFINDMAKAAHQTEGANFHPTTTAIADLGGLANGTIDIGKASRSADDTFMIYLDIWGVNLYPMPYGSGFETSFDNYKVKSSKPLLVTEYGIDAYDNGNSTTYEDVQATDTIRLWNSIKDNTSGVCIGGSIMAYSDEWWKDGVADNPHYQDTGGGSGRSDQPDGFSNEEWYGIMSISDNGSGPDILTPRLVYYKLKEEWK